jgi:hypothetical protein
VNNPTSAMTVRETAEYLAKQQQKGWPGSISIHPYGSKKTRAARINRANEQAEAANYPPHSSQYLAEMAKVAEFERLEALTRQMGVCSK